MRRFSPLSEYVCSKCGSIFDADRHVEISKVTEDCPKCGAFLADSLNRRRNIVVSNVQLNAPKFQTAFDLTRFKIDIEQINKFMPLSDTGTLAIIGQNANLLLTRLCVRALLPAHYGGLGSHCVIIIDAGNKSDFYLTVNFIKQYGLHLRKTLDRIIVSRTFTIYQLKSLLLKLPQVIQEYQPAVLVMPGLLDLFEDPNIKKKEAKSIIIRIKEIINDLSNRMLVITSVQDSKYTHLVIPSFNKRITLSNATHGRLGVELYNEGKTLNVTLTHKELRLVRPK